MSFAQVEFLEDWTSGEASRTEPEPCSSSDVAPTDIPREVNLDRIDPQKLENPTVSVDAKPPRTSNTLAVTPGAERSAISQDTAKSAAPHSHNCAPKDNTIQLQRVAVPFGPDQLRTLLESSITGQSLFDRSTQGEFSSQSQKELVGILAEYHLSLGIKTTEDVLHNYATAIVLLFKQEKKVSLAVFNLSHFNLLFL